MRTKEKITLKALELFNQHGIEYVGMRELASSLGMQIGNINYYFPTKDDLVGQLAMDLSSLNEKTLTSPKVPTMFSFLEMSERSFKNQHAYRCLFLSFVHIIKQNQIIAKNYKKVEKARKSGFANTINMLQKHGYIETDTGGSAMYLASAIGLIARFWISEAAISYNHMPVEQQIRHYVGLIAGILKPFATKQGCRHIENFLKT